MPPANVVLSLSGLPEQRAQAFLLKMTIVRENLRQSFLAHGLHGDAIREAVAFARAATVEFETCQERFPALGNDPDHRVLQYGLNIDGTLPAHGPRGPRENVQILNQVFANRY